MRNRPPAFKLPSINQGIRIPIEFAQPMQKGLSSKILHLFKQQ